MIYTKRRTDPTTRIVGLVGVIMVNILVFIALLNMVRKQIVTAEAPPEVVIEQEEEIQEEEPPPPPDIPEPELVVPEVVMQLPDIIIDVPRPQAPVVVQRADPPPAPRPAPVPSAPPRPALPPVKPVPDYNRLARMMQEDYPPRLQRAKIEGNVTVSMCVDVRGSPSDVKLVKSSGEPALDEATVKGVARLRFTPAKGTDGKPTAWCDPPHLLEIQWRLPKD